MSLDKPNIIGGGFKKVLYTLNTVKRMGFKKSAKTLKSNNACKACALGMGGQRGGMVNELDEFPSVCNKSIQAQSSDLQEPIPKQVFEHKIKDFKQLTAYELEHLGRLNTPLFKAKNSQQYKTVDWDWAISYAAQQFKQTPAQRSFFYSSGRSSNEAGFVLQLFARLYGTNNVNNCSYYCHQATGIGLASAIGTGTATVEIDDLNHCDLIFVIGANPSSNHPRFIHKLKQIRERGGKVIVINPAKEPGLVKFAVPKSPKSLLKGGSEIASDYLQINIGSDLALLKGLAKSIIERGNENQAYINQYCDNFDDFLQDLKQIAWSKIVKETGIEQSEISRIANLYANSKNSVFAWGMGITHHLNGCDNVEYIANLALLRGMIGKNHAGLLPLRGHSNVQGIGTIGVKPVLAKSVLESLEKHLSINLPTEQGFDTLASLQAADKGEVDTALMLGGNLYEASPDTEWTEQALNKIKLKIALTTTLNKGHFAGLDNSESIIFPVTARDEEWQGTTQESMFNYVRLSDGGIKRLDNIKPESHILSEIASQVIGQNTFDFNLFKQHDKIREVIAKVIPELANIKDISIAKKEFHIQGRIKHKPEFATDNGRAKFNIAALPKTSTSDLAYFKLATVRSEGQFNSIIYEQHDSYRGVDQRWAVLMNKEDMDDLGLGDLSTVDISSAHGKMKSVRTYAFSLPRGNLLAYFPEANVLLDQRVDPRSQTPAFKHIRVALSKGAS